MLVQPHQQVLVCQDTNCDAFVFYWELVEAGFADQVKSLLTSRCDVDKLGFVQRQITYCAVLAPVVVGYQIAEIVVSTFLFSNVASFVHPVSRQVLRQVIPYIVGQDNDYALAFSNVVLLDVFQCAPKRLARGAANHQALFFHQPTRH